MAVNFYALQNTEINIIRQNFVYLLHIRPTSTNRTDSVFTHYKENGVYFTILLLWRRIIHYVERFPVIFHFDLEFVSFNKMCMTTIKSLLVAK